jgi:ABC-type antimicrobial peptide transport system permease subunit
LAAPSAQFTAIQPWSSSFQSLIDRQKLFGGIFVLFGVAGLVVAAVGLHGVVAYTVAQRQREFAVRLAMGALPQHIIELIFRIGAVMVLGGTAIGGAIALWAARFGESLLYGVYGIDPVTFIGAEAVLFCVGAVACWFPAKRALSANPIEILRAS